MIKEGLAMHNVLSIVRVRYSQLSSQLDLAQGGREPTKTYTGNECRTEHELKTGMQNTDQAIQVQFRGF